MQPAPESIRDFLAERIHSNLRKVDERASRLRRINLQVLGLSLVFSTAATVLAGLTASTGPLVGSGTPAWRWTCAIVAIVTGAAGLLTGLHQRFQIPDRLARVLACSGQLRRLELALRLSRLTPEEAGYEYEQLVAAYPEDLS